MPGRSASRPKCDCPARAMFLLEASLRAYEGEQEVCHRDWDRALLATFSNQCSPGAVL
jgi:hypothetical protein